MKKYLFIILAFLPLIGISQTYNPIIKSNGKIIKLNGEIILSSNTLEQGLILKLRASAISEDSLTYNSSGDLVTWSNADTVELDGSSEVVIGNSVRFGNPSAGTIYQILDTLGSSDSLILDQTFTGSVTDEFYWGGVGRWYDESENNYSITQGTAVRMPKLIWFNTDSSKVVFDGVDDYFIFSSINIGKVHSILSNVKFYDVPVNQTIVSLNTSYTIRISTQYTYRINAASYNLGGNFMQNIDYKILLTRLGTLTNTYISGDLVNSASITEPNNVDFLFTNIGRRAGTNDLYLNGEIKDLIIYDRELTYGESIRITE